MSDYIDIVFDGPPDHVSGRFVEVENEQGQGIGVGTWIKPDFEDDAPLWRLRIKTSPTLSAMAQMIHQISTDKGFTPPSLDNLPEKLLLSVSELVEALEEHRSGHPLVWHKVSPPAGWQQPYSVVSGYGIEIDGQRMSKERLAEMGWDVKPEGILVEIADSIIRNLHMMHSLIEESSTDGEVPEGMDVNDIIRNKVAYNASRPYKHGRKY